MFHLDPPPNFQGLRKEVDVDFSERHLPHWRQKAATYFVTFRLGDSLPAEQQKQIREIRFEWEAANPKPRSRQQLEELVTLVGRNVEKWLDAGLGSCVFKEVENRRILEGVFGFFGLDRREALADADLEPRYELGAWVIMPNHVHLLVRPLELELSKILQNWKRRSSREINRLTGNSGSLWMSESFDRIVRDPQHLWRCLQYIGKNPEKANLKEDHFSRWVRPEWRELGWKFDDGD